MNQEGTKARRHGGTEEERRRRWWAVAVLVVTALAAVGTVAWGETPASAIGGVSLSDPAKRQTFLQLLLQGGWFMVPIGLASLMGLALILERAVALRRWRIIPRGFMEELQQAGTDRQKAMAYCREHPSPVARIMLAGLRKLPQGSGAVERAMEDAGANEIHRLRRNLRTLYGVSVVSPMMGLLGTVWGMIEAFRVASESKGLGRPELLATGIYVALVTTMAGLMVAIPALMFYYYFAGKVEQAVAELNDASLEFIEQFVEQETIAEMDPRISTNEHE